MRTQSEFQKIAIETVNNLTKNNYIKLDTISYDLSEDIETEETHLKNCFLKIRNFPDSLEKETTFVFNSEGKGFVDAFYSGLIQELNLFSTLKDFVVSNFKILADTKKDISTKGQATAQLTIVNKNNKEAQFVFDSHKSFSMNLSAIDVVIQAIEFFINAEQAIIIAFRSLKDAKKRHRQDLVVKYTNDMSTLTMITSYANVVETEKKK